MLLSKLKKGKLSYRFQYLFIYFKHDKLKEVKLARCLEVNKFTIKILIVQSVTTINMMSELLSDMLYLYNVDFPRKQHQQH